MRMGLAVAAAVLCAPALAQDVERLATEAFAAASEGDIERMNELMKAGLNVNHQRNGRSMLAAAVTAKRVEAVRFLLARGADPRIISYTPYVVGYDTPRPLIEYARKLGSPEIIALLEAHLPTARSTATAAAAGNRPAALPQSTSPRVSGHVSAHWERPGAYAPGQDILLSTNGGLRWRPGKIIKVGAGEYERKYLVVDETGQNHWVSWTHVTVPTRQAYWTSYFVGDWRLHTGMSMVERTDGRDVYRIVEGGVKLPPLRVLANGTYSWITVNGKRLSGRWAPRADAPGIVLEQGDKGLDWTLYNSTSVPSVDIHRADEVRLYSPIATGALGLRLGKH